MRTIALVLSLCSDCACYASNGDTSGIWNAKTADRVAAGVDRLGHISADWNADTRDGVTDCARTCDACARTMDGRFYRFARLSAETPEAKRAPLGRIELSKACSRYGASMGRASAPLFGRVQLQRMRLSDSGACYDSGGAYWGAGDSVIGWMYVAQDSGGNQAFVRARTRGEAKSKLVAAHAGVSFYR